MLTADAALVALCYAQPPILGAVLFVAARRRLATSATLGSLGLVRQRRPGVRAFECAVAPRLGAGAGAHPGAEGAAWAFVALFLIYDLDLLFFLSEAAFFHHWSASQAALGALYAALLLVGAWADNNAYSPTWAYLP